MAVAVHDQHLDSAGEHHARKVKTCPWSPVSALASPPEASWRLSSPRQDFYLGTPLRIRLAALSGFSLSLPWTG